MSRKNQVAVPVRARAAVERRVLVALMVIGLVAPALAGQPGGTLRGLVVVEQTGVPLADAQVQVAGRAAITDAGGAFEVADLLPGAYVVDVRHAQHEAAVQQRIRIEAGGITDILVAIRALSIHEAIIVSGIDVRRLLPRGVEGTPGAASTLLTRDLRQYRPYSMHDALMLLPGVRTIDDDALGRRAGIGVRGAPARRSRRVLLLEDGVPINAATYLDPSTHYTPPIERLERIDVLKGAGQIVHGPLNNHGIINFQTMQPTAEPQTVFDGGLGTRGTFRRHASHTRSVGPVGLVLAYTGMNAEGVFDSETQRYDDLFGSATWTLGRGHELAGSVMRFSERSGYDERNLSLDEYAEDARGKLRLGEGVEFNEIAVGYVKGHVTHRFTPDERLTLTSHVFVSDLDRPRFESRRGGPDAEGGYMRGRERRYTTYGVASRAERVVAPRGPVRQTSEAGLRWERQRFDNRNTVGALEQVLTSTSRGTLAVRDTLSFFEDGRRELLEAWAVSGFVQHTVEIGPVTVVPGLRVERYAQSREAIFRPGAPLSQDSDARSLLLPGIGVRYAVARDTQLYAGVHRGYSPAIARTEDFPLVPETGVDTQVSMRSRRWRGLTLDLAGYVNRLQNTIVKKTFTDEFGANVFVNSGDSTVRGLDASARVDSSAFTGGRTNVFLQAAYSVADARFTAGPFDRNRIPEVPLHAGTFTVGLERPSGGSASVTLGYFGRFYTDEANTDALSAPDASEPLEIVGAVPSHALLSARAALPLHGTLLALWLQGRNLANALYISDVQDGLRPGQGRTVTAGLRVAF